MTQVNIDSEFPFKNNGGTILNGGDASGGNRGTLKLGVGSSVVNTTPKRQKGIVPIFDLGEFSKTDTQGNFVFLGSEAEINSSPQKYVFSQIGQSIVPSGTLESVDRDKWLGYTVSSSVNSGGNIIAYGAPRGDSVDGEGHETGGYARVHQYDGTSWVQVGGDILGDSKGDEFGFSVDLDHDGDTLVAGARFDDGWLTSPSGPASGYDQGHARVFRYSENSWSQLGSDIEPQQNNVAASGDHFGSSVGINGDGDRVVIGAPQLFSANRGNSPSYLNDDSRDGKPGYVEVYTYEGSSWSKTGSRINCFDPTPDDDFGKSVSINKTGDIIAIGCPRYKYQTEDDKLRTGNEFDFNRGLVQVHKFNSTSSEWEIIGGAIHGKRRNANFGDDVSLSEDGLTVAVGSKLDQTSANIAGAVEVFSYQNDGWIQKGSTLRGDATGDRFGYSVSLSANAEFLAVGAATKSDAIGVTYIYKYDGDWIEIGELIGDESNGYFGHDVSAIIESESNMTIVSGSPYTGGTLNLGSVRVYKSSIQDVDNDFLLNDGAMKNMSSRRNVGMESTTTRGRNKVYLSNGKRIEVYQAGATYNFISPQTEGGSTPSQDSALSARTNFTYISVSAGDKTPESRDY